MGSLDDPTYWSAGIEEASSYAHCTFCDREGKCEIAFIGIGEHGFLRRYNTSVIQSMCRAVHANLTIGFASFDLRSKVKAYVPINMTHDEFLVSRIHHD